MFGEGKREEVGRERERERERGEGGEKTTSHCLLMSIMCHGCSWVSCSVWLNLLLQQLLLPLSLGGSVGFISFLSLSLPFLLSFFLFSSLSLSLSLSLSVCLWAQLYSGSTFCCLDTRCTADPPSPRAQLGD